MRRSLVVCLSLAACLAGCGERGVAPEGYRIVVHIPDPALAASIDKLEISLVGACPAEAMLGSPATEVIHSFEARPGEDPPTFGEVMPGMRGLHVRGFDEQMCGVIAAACTPVELVAGGGGDLEITVLPIAAQLCPMGSECRDGQCVAIPDPVDPEQRWADVPCPQGPDSFCGDRISGLIGICYFDESTSRVRCCVGCYDFFTGRCEAGSTTDHCGWAGNECDDCLSDEVCMSTGPIRECS